MAFNSNPNTEDMFMRQNITNMQSDFRVLVLLRNLIHFLLVTLVGWMFHDDNRQLLELKERAACRAVFNSSSWGITSMANESLNEVQRWSESSFPKGRT